MTYYNPLTMTEDQRSQLLQWLESEGLNAREIVNDGSFSVHNGRVAGKRYLLDEDGVARRFGSGFVKVPFNEVQKNPLPAGF
jgi:hypothetical protein